MKFNSFLAFLFTLIAIITIIYGLFMEYTNLLQPEVNCEDYSLFLFPDLDKVNIEIGRGILVKIRAINAGSFWDEYEVSINGPDWAVIKPESFSLRTEEARTLFLYISPSLGTEGKYDVEINVKSECVVENQIIEVSVLKE